MSNQDQKNLECPYHQIYNTRSGGVHPEAEYRSHYSKESISNMVTYLISQPFNEFANIVVHEYSRSSGEIDSKKIICDCLNIFLPGHSFRPTLLDRLHIHVRGGSQLIDYIDPIADEHIPLLQLISEGGIIRELSTHLAPLIESVRDETLAEQNNNSIKEIVNNGFNKYHFEFDGFKCIAVGQSRNIAYGILLNLCIKNTNDRWYLGLPQFYIHNNYVKTLAKAQKYYCEHIESIELL